MSKIVVYFQSGSDADIVSKASLAALTAALEIKAASGASSVVGVTLGEESEGLAQSLKGYGLSSVHYVEAEEVESLEAIASAYALEQAIEEIGDVQTVVMAATSHGKDVAPRIAATLEAGQASDIIGVNEDGTYVRPMFAGDVIATVKVETPVQVVTVRASAFAPAAAAGGETAVSELEVDSFPDYIGEVLEQAESEGERPDLGDADVVVSGGRALQSEENFEKYMFPLADSLGAAVGASRAAVDSGYAPNDWQVGQTGKIVAPQLYIAVGISGAIQHIAGMKGSKTIVAINKDPDAPIFEIADFGLVMDLFDAVPELTEKIKGLKA